MNRVRILALANTLLFMGLLGAERVSAQSDIIGIGDWRVHAPYSRAQIVEIAGDRVYGASNVGLFYYDQQDQSLNELSKIDELSDVGISAIGYDHTADLTVFCYTNGNIDILQGNSLFNINDIERAQISGSKKINALEFRDGFAYLSCDFGVVVLDLNALEVKETYRNIAPNGVQPKVFDSAINFNTDSIFLATSAGLLAASLQPQYNLLDFNSWKLMTDTSGTALTGTVQVEYFHDTLLVAQTDKPILAMKDGKQFDHNLPWDDDGSILLLKSAQDMLLIGKNRNLSIATSLFHMDSTTLWPIQEPVDGAIDENGHVWIADNIAGISNNKRGFFRQIGPNGPETQEIFRFFSHENKVFALAGGYSPSFVPLNNSSGFYVFENNTWTSYEAGKGDLPLVYDLNAGVYNDVTGKYYFGSHRSGLVVWDGTSFTVINDTTPGSTLISSLSNQSWVKITGVATDDDGNVWITNHESNTGPSLHKLAPNGEFTAYNLTDSRADFPADIDIDAFGIKWITIGGSNNLSGIIAYDDQTGAQRYLSNDPGNGGLPVSKVTDLAIDKENAVWVGMTEGVAVFYDTETVLDGTSYNATLPIVEGRPLLQDEEVTCITIDGGNRKWIGTSNGVFLFDDNGTKALINFNIDNSPLPSNNIVDIGINEHTGEVFFGTDLGIISYWGTATEGEAKHETHVNIFPNPVTPDFDGIVGISGLASDATVKITDVSGKLIYETDAEGGLATWNTKDLNGQKAKTGMYMVYSSSVDGTDGFVGKIAIIE